MLCRSHSFTPPRLLKINRQSFPFACTNRSSQTWSRGNFPPQICLRCALGVNTIAKTYRGMAHISSNITTLMVYVPFFSIDSELHELYCYSGLMLRTQHENENEWWWLLFSISLKWFEIFLFLYFSHDYILLFLLSFCRILLLLFKLSSFIWFRIRFIFFRKQK